MQRGVMVVGRTVGVCPACAINQYLSSIVLGVYLTNKKKSITFFQKNKNFFRSKKPCDKIEHAFHSFPPTKKRAKISQLYRVNALLH